MLLLYPQVASDGPLRARFDLTDDGGCIDVATLDLCRDLTAAEGRRELEDELRFLLAGLVR